MVYLCETVVEHIIRQISYDFNDQKDDDDKAPSTDDKMAMGIVEQSQVSGGCGLL